MCRGDRGRHRVEESMDRLRSALQDEADRHRPDRDRMLARIAQETQTCPAEPLPALRRAGPPTWAIRVTLATAGVITLATIGGWQLVEGHLSPPVASENQTSSTTTVRPAPPAPASSSPAETATGTFMVSAALDSHSSDHWGQANLILTAVRPLTRLTVTIQVIPTAGAAFHASWTTLPGGDFTSQMTATPDAIVYRWELKPGRTAQVGTHSFGAQYDRHPGSHDLRRDTFTVSAVGTGPRTTVRGHY